jgi:sn-glycerol 3-phosphate transport system permease protein
MYVVSPYVITGAMAVVGAVFLGWIGRRLPGNFRLWAVLGGAIAGAIGTQVFMAPLGYCTFESERLNGLIEEGESIVPNLIAGGVLILVGVALLMLVALFVITRLALRQSLIPTANFRAGTFNSAYGPLLAMVFLLPTLVTLSVFHYYPLAQTFRVATRIVRLGAPRTRFICMDNFLALFTDPGYYYTLFITFAIAIGVVVVSMSVSLLIAQMANQPIRGANIYRALLIWPIAISPVVAGVLFQLLFNPITGVVNHLIEGTFGFRIPWLGAMPYAAFTIILTAAWNQSGFNVLFYIAGLQNINKELLEAASIDGATPLQSFFRITFPLLSPFTFFLVVTNTIYAFFQTFGVIDILTQGGPVDATATAMYLVYVIGVQGKNLGRGAAQSLVLFMLVVGITIIQFRTSQERITYGV